ncbi:MAG: hypothetical protein BJ554DRAFT_4020, partial [Olpidium bornovanus]
AYPVRAPAPGSSFVQCARAWAAVTALSPTATRETSSHVALSRSGIAHDNYHGCQRQFEVYRSWYDRYSSFFWMCFLQCIFFLSFFVRDIDHLLTGSSVSREERDLDVFLSLHSLYAAGVPPHQ